MLARFFFYFVFSLQIVPDSEIGLTKATFNKLSQVRDNLSTSTSANLDLKCFNQIKYCTK